MRVLWLGPYRVADTVNKWVYVLEDILTMRRRAVYVQRMRLFADSAFKVTGMSATKRRTMMSRTRRGLRGLAMVLDMTSKLCAIIDMM